MSEPMTNLSDAAREPDAMTRTFAPVASLREDMPDGEHYEPTLTVFRASHDSIVMGLYTTAAEARKHCEAEERRAWATGSQPTSFDWIEDEEDGVAELTAWVGGEEFTTGYVVTPLEVASEYDPDGDE